MDDFEFGAEMPEDDDELFSTRDEYDANNEDTFGEGIEADFDHPDLSNYAEQTSALGKQFGDMWNAPGRSTDAPDPSNLPMPTFNFDDSFGTPKDDPWSASEGLFNMWSSTPPTRPAVSRTPMMPDSDKDPFVTDESRTGRRRITPGIIAQGPCLPSDYVGVIGRPVPQTVAQSDADFAPLTASHLEQRLVEEARKRDEQPKLPPMLAAMFQAESEAAAKRATPLPQQHQQQQQPQQGPHAGLPPPLRMDPRLHPQGRGGMPPTGPPGLSMPPSGQYPGPPGSGPQMPMWVYAVPPNLRRFIPVWMQLITRQIPQLPPGVPPVHGALIDGLKAYASRVQASGGMRMPPQAPYPGPPGQGAGGPPQGPPPQHMMREGNYHMHSMMRGPGGQYGGGGDQWRSRPGSSMSMMSTMSRKPPGFPTGKTIEDFAFDPYAGFMSKKEREWLMKIQYLQCLGSGDPYVEDYYFTMMQQKGTVSRSESQEGNGLSDKKKKDLVPRNYNAPKFNGSLGKPVASTTTNPRHLIDVSAHADSVDDDESTTEKRAQVASQKKLKTLLLSMENAAVVLLQAEDRMRANEDKGRTACDDEVLARFECITAGLFTASTLSKLLTIPKGRRLLAHFVAAAPPNFQMRLITGILEAAARLRAASRLTKDTVVAIEEDLVRPLCRSMEAWGRDQLVEMGRAIDAAMVCKELENRNALVRDLLLCFVYACARCKAHSSAELFSLLKATATPAIDWAAFAPPISAWRDASGLGRTQLEILADWLRLLTHGSSHVGARLANAL